MGTSGCGNLGNMKCRRSKNNVNNNNKKKKKKKQKGKASSDHGFTLRTKVKKLQGLIPGGKGLRSDQLLLRTTDYILQLKLQVNVLEALSKIYNHP